MDKPLEFILVPKCPLFGDSTVLANPLPHHLAAMKRQKLLLSFSEIFHRVASALVMKK